jgi:hypothetical protein
MQLQFGLPVVSLVVHLQPLADAVDFLELREEDHAQFGLLDNADEEFEDGLEVVDVLLVGEGISEVVEGIEKGQEGLPCN